GNAREAHPVIDSTDIEQTQLRHQQKRYHENRSKLWNRPKSNQQEHTGPHEIELLLDCERPQVSEEPAALAGGIAQERRSQPKRFWRYRDVAKGGHQEGKSKNEARRRDDAKCPPHVECAQRYSTCALVFAHE